MNYAFCTQQFYFAQDAFGVDQIIEGIDNLNGGVVTFLMATFFFF
jgi:hypothetical protein